MFIAMNHFKVAPGKETEFERIWTERETYLEGVPGFVRFALLRTDDGGDYVSHSEWESRDAFMNWMNSEAFVKGHRQGSLAGILAGPPRVSLHEPVFVQRAGESTKSAHR